MQQSTLAKSVCLLLFAGAAVTVYLYGLGLVPLLGPDEPRYAQVAREMFARADLVTPTLGGHTWFEKPALLYWLMMMGYKVWGVSEFTARLPAACSGLVTILAIAWLARRVERTAGHRVAGLTLSSAAVLASSAGLIAFSRGASFDIVLTVSITLALCCFMAADLEPHHRRKVCLLVGFYAGMGLALLAKGLVGLVIPCGVVGFYLILQRRWPGVKSLGLLWGPFVALAVALLWYGPVIARHGWLFVDEFFIQHHFARYTSNRYRHPQPVYFYLWVAPLLAMPWAIFLLDTLKNARKFDRRSRDADARLRVFACAWMLVPIGFFSLSGSKLPGYILPSLPAMALLVGDRLASYLRGDESGARLMRITGALIAIVGSAGSLYAFNLGFISSFCAASIAAVMGAAWAVISWPSEKRWLSAAAIVLAVFLTVPLAINCASSSVAARESVRDLIRAAAQRGYQNAPIVNLHTVERSAEFYAPGRLFYDQQGEPLKLEGAGEVLDLVRRGGKTVLLVVVPVEHAKQLLDHHALQAEAISDNGSVAIIAVSER